MADAPNKLQALAQDALVGSIFKDEETYAEWRDAFSPYVEGIDEVKRAHDVGLKNYLEKNGRDSFDSGEFFRTPRGWSDSTPKTKSVDTLSKLAL
jgi:hypothetical protein